MIIEKNGKKYRWRWNDNFPPHLKNFMESIEELYLLRETHFQYLSKQADDPNEFDDKETVFLRSAVVMLVAHWEFYVESLLHNAMENIIANIEAFDQLPQKLKKLLAKSIKESKNELSPWQLAGDCWREYVREYTMSRLNALNTPKSTNIQILYSDFLDIDILSYWHWVGHAKAYDTDVDFDVKGNINWIDGVISYRGSIAHGVKDREYCYFSFHMIFLRIQQIAVLMNNAISQTVTTLVGKEPWIQIKFTPDWSPLVRLEVIKDNESINEASSK